ncbi:hypothetical protein PMAYCL1PPCAC_11839 [Pristionchus mayeri]|uniref:Uncharacterized protein n=1 Tax=Pristionchus mayeri TaxID=1317129 RepID=A0AAN5CFS9_9BILA|nr:hypothetical protein PMAYCL1PPCAC_11839 [Pristionchus mayeri]
MDDDETWLTGSISSTTTSSSSSKGTQSDLDSWLNTTASAIDFSTRSALSRKLKGYSDKKARRRQLRTASTVSLESVSEESPRKGSVEEEDLDTKTLRPLAQSSPLDQTVDRSLYGQRSLDECDGAFPDDDEEYKQLEEAALGMSMEERVETTQEDDEEFLSAASEFEDEELEAAHHNGRSRELESLDEEPMRATRQQMLGSRLGVAPRSSSVSPRLSATVTPTPPKGVAARVERVSAEIYSTPVGTTATLPRRPTPENKKGGGMSVSLHIPSGHLPPRRIPPGRVENGKGGGGGVKDGEKKVNLHEDLAKIQDLAREQEEALRREVMGSLSANDVSNGENDSRLITNSKSVEFVGKKEFHSRLPTPSRRVMPVRGKATTGPLRAAPNSVMPLTSSGRGSPSLSQSRPASGQNGHEEDDCF